MAKNLRENFFFSQNLGKEKRFFKAKIEAKIANKIEEKKKKIANIGANFKKKIKKI